MFNMINKKNSWKKMLLTLILGGILFTIPQISSAWIREEFPRYRLRVGTNNIANMLSTWTKAITSYDSSKYDAAANKFTTDIFWDNASRYKAKNQAKALYWLESVKGVLKSRYPNCNIKEKYLLGILFYTSWTWVYIRDEIIKSVPSWQWPTLKDRDQWCKQLTTCMLWANKNLTNTSCDEEVRNAYFDWTEIKRRSLELEESNLWVEKYYNWTLDDSSYDIFYDMWQLAKIFYEDVKPVTSTSVIFYKMPQFGKWSNGNWWGDDEDKQNQKEEEKQQWKDNQKGQPNPSWDGNQPWEPSDWWDGNPQPDKWWKKWWDSLPKITDDDEINDLINNWTEEQKTVTNNWNTAYVNKCVVSWSPKLEEAYLEAEEEEDLGEDIPSPFEVSEEYIDELLKDIIDNSKDIKKQSKDPLTWENAKEPDDVPWEKWASDNPAVIDELRKELQSCVDKCDWLRFDERAICKAKCLCAEYSSKALPEDTEYQFLQEWALRIRICNIPSKPVVVSTSTKYVMSIETILAEIRDVVKALFESWELTPKMKKQEWLDTSMNNIKFSDIVSFNIWMQFKKPTTERGAKKEDMEELKKNLEDEILQITQNWFNVMWDVKLSTYADTSMSKTPQVPKLEPISEDTSALMAIQRIASINKTYHEFLQTNDNFIKELKLLIDEMSKTIEWKLKW